jgi:hypothetical protein
MAALPGYKRQEHKGINIMSGYLVMPPRQPRGCCLMQRQPSRHLPF